MTLKQFVLQNIDDFNNTVKTEEELKIKVILPYLKELGYLEKDMNFESPIEVVIGSKKTMISLIWYLQIHHLLSSMISRIRFLNMN